MNTTFAPTLRRLLVCALAITAILTGVLLFAPEEAAAAPCCFSCDRILERCEAGCNGDPACLNNCLQIAQSCYNVCIFCW